VTLWFLDRGKAKGPRGDQVLFIDARHVFRQDSRAHRSFTPEQIEFLGNIVRLWRGQPVETEQGSQGRMAEAFGTDGYQDVLGLCKVASRVEIASQDWSLNPGRYVGVKPGEEQDDEDFKLKLEAMQEELEVLNTDAARLQVVIAENVAGLLAA
jgi:type I restriction enzyme M protein